MNEKEIRSLIKIVEETGIDELEIRKGWGKRIRIVKNAAPTIHHGSLSGSLPVAPQVSASESAAPSHNYTEVKSPMVGTLYRAPAPEEPPFVSVGDRVKSGQTLCIIEAMKVMNEIEAEVSGVVAEMLVENAEAVEFNQTIFYIDESA